MLSRATLLSGQSSKALVAFAARTTSTTAAKNAAADDAPVQVPRLTRMEPGKVRLGFIPEEWFEFFYKKTGVTGPYTLGVTLSTYLISKEIYVMEHEFYSGLSILLMSVVAIKKFGPSVAKWLDKEIDTYEAEWNATRDAEKNHYTSEIAEEEKNQWRFEGQNLLVNAKRENVALQLEAEYRERLLTAYNQVKKRLDYQVEKQNIERRIAQKNLVDYVVSKVRSSITPDQEKQNINRCISDLALLAKA